MIKNYLPLVHGIIEAFLFLETSESSEVNPDSAVRCMENIAASLLALEPIDQLALRSNFEQIAKDSQDQSYKEFVQKLPDMIGLSTA